MNVECLWFKLAQLSEVRAACAIDGYPMFDALRHGASLDVDPSTIINERPVLPFSVQRNLSALNLAGASVPR